MAKVVKSKTVYTTDKYKVGDAVILYSTYHDDGITAGENEKFFIMPDNGMGIPGNMNPNICRYHGWCGTSYKEGVEAYGLRKVKKVIDTGRKETFQRPMTESDDPRDEVCPGAESVFYDLPVYKIIVGDDIAPEME